MTAYLISHIVIHLLGVGVAMAKKPSESRGTWTAGTILANVALSGSFAAWGIYLLVA